MNIPSTLIAGDTWSWTESLASYQAPTWTVKYYLRGPQSITLSASDSGADHAFSVAAGTTAGYKPGVYDWIARVDDGTTFTTIDEGRLTIRPDLSNAAHEYRSFWRKVLDELEPVILGRASQDTLSGSVAGRSFSLMSWDELLKVYDRAKLEVASDQGDSASRYVVSPRR